MQSNSWLLLPPPPGQHPGAAADAGTHPVAEAEEEAAGGSVPRLGPLALARTLLL